MSTKDQIVAAIAEARSASKASCSLLTTRLKVRVLSVSQRFLSLNTFVKRERIITKSFIDRVLRKGSWMKVMVFFDIFGEIGAMVLIITFEQIELEGCACA